jgi:hypothetical protein
MEKGTKSFENNKRSDTVFSHPHELMDYQLQMYLVKKLFGAILFKYFFKLKSSLQERVDAVRWDIL